MNNSLDYAALSIAEDNAPESTQYITFNVSGYVFGLPSKAILRVVTTPPANKGGLISMGMVQLGPYNIQIIDLVSLLALDDTQSKPSAHSSRAIERRKSASRKSERRESERREKSSSFVAPAKNPPFLVVLQNTDGEFWGIALDEPPDLMDVPNYALKPVPEHRKTTRSLQWVSHIVSYDLNSNRHSLLILDLSLVIDPEGKAAPMLDETVNLSAI